MEYFIKLKLWIKQDLSNVVANSVLRYLSIISDKKLQRGNAACKRSG